MTFYDDSGDVLYDFYKENPRTVQGHTAGDLQAPPAPTPLNENADSGGPMIIISGIFIVTAVGMGLWIAASHALAQAGYKGLRRGALRFSRAPAPPGLPPPAGAPPPPHRGCRPAAPPPLPRRL